MKTSFEKLFVWQESRVLVNQIYKAMDSCRDWGFKDQIQRAAVSIMNNIAEGTDCGSDLKYVNFLNIARASCSEVRSMTYLCEDLGFCESDYAEKLREKTLYISSGINNLIKSIKQQTNVERDVVDECSSAL